MPVLALDRLPMPSLQTYTAISVLALGISILYGAQVTSHPGWQTDRPNDITDDIDADSVINLKWMEIFNFAKQDHICVWTLINMGSCCLLILAKVIQNFIFGELRVSEQQHIRDKFWNFVFYKFIFIFGIINVNNYDEILMWYSWFSIIGFLHILTQLCLDRCDYVCFSPVTTRMTHVKLISLLLGIFTAAFGLFILCLLYQWTNGLNTFMFLAVEFVLLVVKIIQIMVRYGIYFREILSESVWEDRAMYTYYSELRFELAILVIGFIHHIHMLCWSKIFLSMATLTISMQLRCMFNEIQRRLTRHNNYLRIVKHMEENYPMATPEELGENGDECAICWEKLETARKLPCGHMFHNTCLQSWLEQDPTCPTCRQMLTVNQGQELNNASDSDGAQLAEGAPPEMDQMRQATINHFHFDGSRYISWFPSFSVEVTHRHTINRNQSLPTLETSQLDSMVRQVQQMFPNLPTSAIAEDLLLTRSVELTVENILDDRLVATNIAAQNTRPSSSLPSPSSSTETSETNGASPSYNIVPSTESVRSSPQHQSNSTDTLAAGDSEEDNCSSTPGAGAHASGGRFSKSIGEREKMLLERKQLLLKNARKKYLSSLVSEHSSRSNESKEESQGTGADDHVRNLAFMAAQRRLNNQSNHSG